MFPKQEKRKDGSDFDDFLTKTIGAPSKKIDHAETTAPKRPRRNVRAETRTTEIFLAGIFSVGLIGYEPAADRLCPPSVRFFGGDGGFRPDPGPDRHGLTRSKPEPGPGFVPSYHTLPNGGA